MITTISSSQSLAVAIKAAKAGDTILLLPGTYSSLSLRNVDFTSDVTIRSADISHRAVLSGFTLDGVSGLRFEQLELRVDLGTDSKPYEIRSSQDITLDQVWMHGSMDGDPQNDRGGLAIQNASGVTVKNSEFEQLLTGIGHLNSNNLVLTDNSIHDIQLDGIRGGGSSNVLIARNTFSDFHPVTGDHPDAIQFWTTNTTAAAHDISVIDNSFIRGDGRPAQGVFIRDETGHLPFQNVTISGNLIVGGMYNGVFVDGAANVKITGNIVTGFTDMKSYFWITDVAGATITGNTANSFGIQTDVTGLVARDNTVVALSSNGGAEAISAWNALHGGGGGIPAPSAPSTNEGTDGVDTMTGGAGDDIFNVTPGDVIIEAPGGGVDTLISAYTVGAPANVENIILTGGRWAGAYGNDLDNQLVGSKTPNVLKGKAGDDTLDGGAGADTLHGGPGADRIVGGAGADTVVFERGGGHDVIVDFGLGGESDALDLSDFLAAGLKPTLTQVGGDLRIAFGSDDVLILGLRAADLTATATGYVFG